MMKINSFIPPEFRGCVSIRENGKPLLLHYSGFADLPNGVSNTPETRFATASAGKAFVAVGIMQMIEKDTLKFEDTLGDLLPGDWKEIDRNITVRQLLCHTSGIPDYCDESVIEDYADLWRDYPNYKIRHSSDLLPLFIDKPMLYPAGERFQYNNTGFVVLGMILEQLTGQEFDAVLREKVFLPCKMLDTGYYELDRLPERCANSYIYDKERNEYYTNIYSVDAKGTGAGGAFTTVLDVERFWDGLLDGKLLSSELVTQMMSVQSGGDGSRYGFGLWLDQKPEGRFTPHFEGCDPGVSFLSSFDPSSGLSFTAVSNYGDNVWRLERDFFTSL